jgi:hypothetical protein
MVNPRKPAAIHRLQGTFKPSIHDRNPTTTPCRRLIRPRHLPKSAKAAWDYLVHVANGRLTFEDAATLEAAAMLLARIRDEGTSADAKDLSQYRMFLRELKLTAGTRDSAPEDRDESWNF